MFKKIQIIHRSVSSISKSPLITTSSIQAVKIPSNPKSISVKPVINTDRILANAFRNAILLRNTAVATSTFELIQTSKLSSFSSADLLLYFALLVDSVFTPVSLLHAQHIYSLILKSGAHPLLDSLMKYHAKTGNIHRLVETLALIRPDSLISHETIVFALDSLVSSLIKSSFNPTSPSEDEISVINSALQHFLLFIQSSKAYKNDPELYPALLHILCSAGLVQESYALKKALAPVTRRKNIREMNTLLSGYLAKDNEKGAMIVLQILKESGQEESIETLNLLFDYYVQASKHLQAEQIYNQIHGIITESTAITGIPYRVDLTNIVPMTELDATIVKPNHTTYQILLKWYAMRGLHTDIVLLIKDLVEKGYINQINDACFQNIIHAYLSAGKYENAITLFKKTILKEIDLSGTPLSYSKTIKRMITSKMVLSKDVHDIYIFLESNQVVLDKDVLECFAMRFTEQLDFQDAITCVARVWGIQQIPSVQLIRGLISHLDILNLEYNVDVSSLFSILCLYSEHQDISELRCPLFIAQLNYMSEQNVVGDIPLMYSQIMGDEEMSALELEQLMTCIETLTLHGSIANIQFISNKLLNSK